MTGAAEITKALGGRWHGSFGTARCPAHDDARPSLQLSDGDGGAVIVHCHAGCDWRDIKAELRRRGLLDDVRNEVFTRKPSPEARHKDDNAKIGRAR